MLYKGLRVSIIWFHPVFVLSIDSRGHTACADSLEVAGYENVALLAFAAGSGSSGGDAERPDGWAAARARKLHTPSPSANYFLKPINSQNGIFSFITLQRQCALCRRRIYFLFYFWHSLPYCSFLPLKSYSAALCQIDSIHQPRKINKSRTTEDKRCKTENSS